MGGINPNIALQGQQPQVQGPASIAQAGMNVQYLINATQLQKQEQAQNALKQQSDQIALQQQQQQQKDQEIFNKAFHDSNGDWDQTIQNATKTGASGSFINQAQIARADRVAKLATATKDQLANEASKHDDLAKLSYAVQQLPQDQQQTAWTKGVNERVLSGAYKGGDLPEQLPDSQTLKTTVAQSKAVQDMIKEAQDLQEKNAKLPGEQAEARGKQLVTASQTMNGVPNQLAWTARRNMLVGNDASLKDLIPEQFSPEAAEQVRQLGITPQQAAQTPVERQELNDFMKHPPAGYKPTPTDFMRYKASIAPVLNFNLANQTGGAGGSNAPADVAKRFGMTQEAFDQAAEKYAATGNLPAVGRGANGIALQRAIMNRTGELHGGESLAANSSEYKANTQSLNKLQSNLDNVTAFENTALKNIDQVIKIAHDIPDLGTRYANIPVRMLTGSMIGTDNMSRLRTALASAQSESAKVLSSANASGVLSDHARDEAKDFLDGNLPLSAMMAQADQLHTDFGNRHESYANQVADIQKRLGAKTPQQQASGGFQLPAGAKTATNPQNGHKIAVVDGKWVDAQTGKPI